MPDFRGTEFSKILIYPPSLQKMWCYKRVRRAKFPGNLHNYIWCPYYLPSFMKFCSVVSEELRWQLCDGQTDRGTDGRTDRHSKVCFIPWPSPSYRQQRKLKNNTLRQTWWLSHSSVAIFIFFLLAIVLSVLRFTDSNYPFGISKLYLSLKSSG
jgi:hypothetical protein